MRPITLTPPKKWLGNVRYRVPAPKWPDDMSHFAPLAEDGDYVFALTMAEVNAFLAQIALSAQAGAEAEPGRLLPQAVAGKICAECGRDRPLSAFHRRTASPDGRERLCKRCASLP